MFSFQWIICIIKKVYSPAYIEFILLPISCSAHWFPTSFKVFPWRRKFMRCQMRWDVCRFNRFKGRYHWAKILVSKLQLMLHNLQIHWNVILLQGRVLSKLLDSEKVRIERAIDLRAKRAGHLGDERKRLKFFHGLLSEDTSEQGVIQGVVDYEGAFHKFVDAHKS